MTTEGLLHAHTLQTLPSTVWPAARGDRHVRITGAPLCHPTDVHTRVVWTRLPPQVWRKKLEVEHRGPWGWRWGGALRR